MGNKSEVYEQALAGKKVPVLTLDNKWYKLFRDLSELPRIQAQEKRLNELVQRQGQLNVDSKNIKKLKRKLMDEIVPMANELEQKYSKALEKQLDEHRRLIEECNEKLEEYQDELLDLPRQIGQINHALMLSTMEYCYDSMQENTRQITEIAQWVKYIRIELKKILSASRRWSIRTGKSIPTCMICLGRKSLNCLTCSMIPWLPSSRRKRPEASRRQGRNRG